MVMSSYNLALHTFAESLFANVTVLHDSWLWMIIAKTL